MLRTIPLCAFLNCFLIAIVACSANAQENNDGSVLPFTSPKMDSVVKRRLQDSTMKWPQQPQRLSKDAPNILIVLIDDIGFGAVDTFGGEIHTPTLTALSKQGIRYNAFHTTSICSSSRAALLTGRNHTRVGSGTIAERAVAFDGFTGIMPKTAATIAEILKQYGYKTSAFGKWHNTPATETTDMGPKDRWPNGYGFEYFYGFLAGETSQFEPRLYENYNLIEPPNDDPSYHLTVDLKEKALAWIDQQQAFSPDKPFFMYWAPGAVHGPHQVFKEWSEKYKGKFDDGWDAYRERVYQRQLKLGIIPPNTKNTERASTMDSWDSIPKSERKFQSRLMEIFAGFMEHTDYEIGELLNGLEERGLKDNTLIFYIVGDNGSSAEGQRGTISELLAQNQIPNTIDQQLAALKKIGGLDALGTAKADNMFHSSWAWATNSPLRSTKLVAAHFGGTRNPMVISWPKKIKPDKVMRSQFHHVNDIAPTIYEVLNIPHPKMVNGYEQMQMDGVSLAYTFADGNAESQKQTQFFDNNGSRGLYHEGWFASAFGPFTPWRAASSGSGDWDSAKEKWQLYDLSKDFSQATDLSAEFPEKLEAMKKLFLTVAKENKDFPIGAGNWLRVHPKDIIRSPYTSWTFRQDSRRMPEFSAPGLGKFSNQVVLDIEVKEDASGVLYALGGSSGGLTLYMDKGYLIYEYNMLLIERYAGQSDAPLKAGKHNIEVNTDIPGPAKPGLVTITVDGQEVAKVELKRTVPLAFTASETFDVGADLGSPVSINYLDRRPFAFSGKIEKVDVRLVEGN